MAKSTIKVSIGWFNMENDIDCASEVLIHEIQQHRAIL